ncbi:hypothetical protein DYB25_013109, partial [Aphanomyces astaci]
GRHASVIHRLSAMIAAVERSKTAMEPSMRLARRGREAWPAAWGLYRLMRRVALGRSELPDAGEIDGAAT